MNKLREVMADIIGALTHIELMGKTKVQSDLEVSRLQRRVNDLPLVRERFAASTLITAMLCEVNNRKMCLAYQYQGKLYCTANNVHGLPNTDYLHTLGMTSDQWNALPRYSVWISTGNVYDVS